MTTPTVPDQGEPQVEMPTSGVIISGSPHIGGDVAGRDIIKTNQAGIAPEDLNKLFEPLLTAVRAAPPEQQAEARQAAEALQAEAAKGDKRDDNLMAELIEGLVELVPVAASALATIFGTPLLGAVAGPATNYVIKKIQKKK